MKIGDPIRTARFGNVRIDAVFASADAASEAGYTVPTFTAKSGYKIVGKSLDLYHMAFAAVKTV